MRFMLIVKASRGSEAGVPPREDQLAAMAKYHEDLTRAGVLLDGSRLQPSSEGARIHFAPDGRRTVIEGPFAEPCELVAGFTCIEVKSKQEAVEWARRMPAPHGDGIEAYVELRQLVELAPDRRR